MNPWKPITNSTDLKYLGKLCEELGELSQVVSRCIIQGTHEFNPDNDKMNLTWLEEEIADVIANIELVRQKFNLDQRAINGRVTNKISLLKKWHEMTEE